MRSLPVVLLAACAHPAPPPACPAPAPIVAPAPPAPAKPSLDDRLAAVGLVAFPDAGGMTIPNDWFQTTSLSGDDVAADFANLDDLAWLEPIAKQHRVFLFGEAHYYQVTHHLGARVLFALNRYDHYGLVTLEMPYSLTAFLDRYVSVADDAAAKAILDAHLARACDVEEIELLDHLRRWNRAHADRAIHVAAHDIEHDRRGVVTGVLAPYFAQLGPAYALTDGELAGDHPVELVAKLTAWLPAARAKKLVGEAGIDADYIARVLANLRSRGLAGDGEQGQFTFYRQHAIVRNLTDPAYLGRYFQTGKVMVWAGAYHTPIHTSYPDGGNFLREGAYLEHDYAPTKGTTYSMNVIGIGYSLGEMASVDPATIGFAGTGYRSALRKLHDGYVAGIVDPARAYLLRDEVAASALAIVRVIEGRSHGGPALLRDIRWDAIGEALPFAKDMIAQFRSELAGYDATVIVPRSPITRRR
jgi:hypothetical protein